MNSKNVVIALLALAVAGGGALAYWQANELQRLRAAAVDPQELAGLRKKVWDLEKANRELQDQLAAAHTATGGPGEEMAAANEDAGPAPEQGGRGRRGAGGRGQQFAAMRELMAKPEVQAMLASAQKTMVQARYAALLRTLNLPPDQASKLEDLLVERQNAWQDVMQAARDQGLDPRTDRDAMRKLVTDSQNAINDNIKSLLGDNGYSQFTNFEQTMPQRNLVNTIQQQLAASGSPLSATQADQLVQILAQNAPARSANTGNGTAGGPGGPGEMGGGFGGRMGFAGGMGGAFAAVANGPTITSQAITQAQSQAGLTQNQVEVLQQVQQQQQNAQQFQQMLRSSIQQQQQQNATSGATGTTGGTTGTTGGAPAGRRRGGG